MAITKYARALLQLLPRGPAWNREEGSDLVALVSGIAEEFQRIEDRGRDLLEETDPRTMVELLGEWEAILGLPDPSAPPGTVTTGNEAVWANLATNLGQSFADYVALAATVSATVEQSHTAPLRCSSPCTDALYGQEWRSVWFVHVASGDENQVKWLFFKRCQSHGYPYFI